VRIQEHLAGDDAGKAALAGIEAGLTAFRAATTGLHDAQAKESIAGTRARSAIHAFERQMEKTYGVLLVEVGKTQAERFFPKVRTGRASAADDDSTPPAPSP